MNLPKLNDIEEEIINFLQKNKNNTVESSIIIEQNVSVNYANQLEDKKNIDLSQEMSNKEPINQKHSINGNYFGSELRNFNQNLNKIDSSICLYGKTLENDTEPPSSIDYSNFNQSQELVNWSNNEKNNILTNCNKQSDTKSERNNVLQSSNTFEEAHNSSLPIPVYNSDGKDYLQKYCSLKYDLPENSGRLDVKNENNPLTEVNEKKSEEFFYFESYEHNDETINCNCCSKAKLSKSESGDDQDTSSIVSDKAGDALEEIIIKEKLNRMNNPLQDNFNEVTEDIIYESNSTIKDKIKKKNELLFMADQLAEAIEYNISVRNFLYDLEHTLLKLVDDTKTATKVVNKKVKSKNRNKFYYKFLAPYFKDKIGFSSAEYFNENIRSQSENACAEDYMRLYRISQPSEIYEIYNAIKKFVLETNGEKILETTEKIKNKRGRKKVIYDNDYSENDLYSMESYFSNFLLKHNPSDLQFFLDKQIDWEKVSSMLVGLTADECYKIWVMVLKPLLELGVWSAKESDDILKIAQAHNYQCWDEIAKELDTGRSGYLCFCHVLSKPIIGLTQNTGAWTAEEDEFLLTLIEKCCYGNSIMWNRIFYCFEDRTVTQVLNRWYRLNPALKRGKFTHKEDIMLLYCVEQFGRDFGKIATLFGNRSPIQLRERYCAVKDLIDETKLGEWSVEEDKLLLNLLKEYGQSKWAEIAAKFPGRNRTQIRHRYTSVLKRWLSNPNFQLESLKRHKRTTHVKAVNRVKQIDTSESDVRTLVESKLKAGKAKLKTVKRGGKHPPK